MSDDRIFGIDAEIALTALLAASVAGLPGSSLAYYSQMMVIATSLLLFTLIRRMAVMQGISQDSALLKTTTYVLDPATYISILYVIHAGIQLILKTPSEGGADPLLFGLAASVIIILVFTTWEIAFRAALEEGERVFASAADRHQGELLGAFLSKMAKTFSSEKIYGEDAFEQMSIDDFTGAPRSIDELSDEEKRAVAKHIVVTFTALLLPVLGYTGLVVVGSYLSSVWWGVIAVLVLLVMLTSGFVRLWYSRYGVVKLEDRNGYLVFIGDVVTFAALYLIVLA